MTKYLNTSLETYKEFVELSKKMAKELLESYNLYGNGENNIDELIINPISESGVTAYVDFENSVNIEELYKTVVMSMVESVTATLNNFDVEQEFEEDWEESGLSADEYIDKLSAAQEEFGNKSYLIDRDASVLANTFGFPKNEENSIWNLTHSYLKFMIPRTQGFSSGVLASIVGYQVEAVYSDKKLVRYNIDVNPDEIFKKAGKEQISDENILYFVIQEVHNQLKDALNQFDAKEDYDKLENKDSALVKYYIKAEKYFKNELVNSL